MSSSFVRKTVKSLITQANLSCPFYDTVNKQQNPTEDRWLTIEFHTEATNKTTFCNDISESGVIDLIFNCEAGAGDDIIEQCEKDARRLFAQEDYHGQLTFQKILTAEEFNHSTQRYFQVVIGIEYLNIFKE